MNSLLKMLKLPWIFKELDQFSIINKLYELSKQEEIFTLGIEKNHFEILIDEMITNKVKKINFKL